MFFSKKLLPRVVVAFAIGLLAITAAGCGDDSSEGDGGSALSGEIKVDGSSTVFPFIEAAAEQFRAEQPDVNVTVGESGTGGGFEKFCAGETDISNASRPIKDEEKDACAKGGVEFVELEVANDGIAVVTNKDLTVECLTTDQLKQIWNKGSKVKSLAEVDPKLPSAELSLYGPGTDSGTFDYFTDEINGEEGASRNDYQPSEDDNVLVQGVAGDGGGFGYFGFSYYAQNTDKLNVVKIDGGDGCVEPSEQSIQDGSYKPLGRPLHIYASKTALGRPEVKAFLDWTLENHAEVASIAKVVPMNDERASASRQALADAGA